MPVLPIVRWLRTFYHDCSISTAELKGICPEYSDYVARIKVTHYRLRITVYESQLMNYRLFKGIVYFVSRLNGDMCWQIAGVL